MCKKPEWDRPSRHPNPFPEAVQRTARKVVLRDDDSFLPANVVVVFAKDIAAAAYNNDRYTTAVLVSALTNLVRGDYDLLDAYKNGFSTLSAEEAHKMRQRLEEEQQARLEAVGDDLLATAAS